MKAIALPPRSCDRLNVTPKSDRNARGERRKIIPSQINERVKASKEVTAPKHPLKERYKKALPQLQKSKVWENPKKQKALEKLLAQIEALIDE
ncbi:hypothetical protein [Mastigocoleus testarum]|uniref:Uncharacterized protein n=1 Tax=Mastigocoleus testarum BC008 TaxID=371196 RepID=A0A0V7ZBR2_9CYAN|nr:hypothetical protein [Mastigocoleus testarum]KST61965.1 hypothetical protein BC008_07985 [Mastigocoleus testarum BC008]